MVQVRALTYLWKPVNLNTITLLNPRIVAVAIPLELVSFCIRNLTLPVHQSSKFKRMCSYDVLCDTIPVPESPSALRC